MECTLFALCTGSKKTRSEKVLVDWTHKGSTQVIQMNKSSTGKYCSSWNKDKINACMSNSQYSFYYPIWGVEDQDTRVNRRLISLACSLLLEGQEREHMVRIHLKQKSSEYALTFFEDEADASVSYICLPEVLGISSSVVSSGLECLALQSCNSMTKQIHKILSKPCMRS